MVSLPYGTGMRLIEGVRLRVKDMDFERGEIPAFALWRFHAVEGFRPIHGVADSTGLKIYGEGKVRRHGVGKRRTYGVRKDIFCLLNRSRRNKIRLGGVLALKCCTTAAMPAKPAAEISVQKAQFIRSAALRSGQRAARRAGK